MLRADELTYPEYETAVAERVCVWPVGILEEHGPHLPLGTDTFQVEAVVEDAAEATGSLLLPTLVLGNAHSTRPFPGTISVTEDTLERVASETLSELSRHGARAVAIVSGHAGSGHMHALENAGERFAETTDLQAAVLSEWDVIYGEIDEPIAGVEIPPYDGHAGAMETARIMDLRPDLVGDPPGDHEAAEHPHILAKDAAASMPDGYGGDPSRATAKLGQELHRIAVDGLVEVLDELEERAGL